MAWILTGLWVLAMVWWILTQVRVARQEAARDRLEREWEALELGAQDARRRAWLVDAVVTRRTPRRGT